MKKSERAEIILDMLDELYPEVYVPLHHQDAFTLLIAVLLSAQCTDERVNRVTPELFQLALTPQVMARIPIERIEQIIRPCGLSSRKASSIQRLSEILVEKHGGQVPMGYDELEALPGVGHKTASVIMSQVFGIPAFPVDTHIHRLAMRWGLSNGSNVVQTERDLKRAFPRERWNDLHLKIIYYGRQYCPARGHDIGKCPICKRLQNG
ncbi:MAG: endonuclease III [Saprospiraceae bacterium]|jgi:endonuclease-3|nr:endonuclease III [Saprospiraceae bacterium]MBP9208915.1 endonuclease III [Saprospiraceae bacterium]MBV6472100.1 Endonuclease III [Saprospiraceae bacterium]